MSPARHLVILLAATLSVHWTHGGCPSVPSNFLDYGPDHTHCAVKMSDLDGNALHFAMRYKVFGSKRNAFTVQFSSQGDFNIPGVSVLPRELGTSTAEERALRVGEVYVRYTTDEADMDKLESMICVHFDEAIIVTYVNVGLTAAAPKSTYQIVIAHQKQQTIVMFNYGTPSVVTERYVKNTVDGTIYPLHDMDISNDGIAIIDVTYSYRAGDGNVTRVSVPCPTCPGIPDSFLSFGSGTTDTSLNISEIFWSPLSFPMPYQMFEWTAPETNIVLTPYGWLAFLPDHVSGSAPSVHIQPRQLPFVKRKELALRTGILYSRFTTDQDDLDQLGTLICDKTIESAIVLTYSCVGLTALEPMSSYQVIAVQSPNRTLLILNLPSPRIHVGDERFIRHGMTYLSHPLNETDIADDGITIIDVTELPTQAYGEVLPVVEEDPCPGKTCQIYTDGRIKTISGATLQNKLTVDKNFVASVDKAADQPNSDPCKFFLLINAENKVPARFVRIAVGVHTKTDSKYLRKFKFSLDDDSTVTEFGQGPDKILRVADMPYAMDDTGSSIALGVTVDVTDANDGWIIKSATCGYSFTYMWGGSDPMITMTLQGDRYQGRIVETCGEV